MVQIFKVLAALAVVLDIVALGCISMTRKEELIIIMFG